MATSRERVRAAILGRDNIALAKCMILFGSSDEAKKVAEEELANADAITRWWWAQPCDFPNSEAEDAIIAVGELRREGQI